MHVPEQPPLRHLVTSAMSVASTSQGLTVKIGQVYGNMSNVLKYLLLTLTSLQGCSVKSGGQGRRTRSGLCDIICLKHSVKGEVCPSFMGKPPASE